MPDEVLTIKEVAAPLAQEGATDAALQQAELLSDFWTKAGP